jgi:putative nucleotidyltransferase with HDIG domain
MKAWVVMGQSLGLVAGTVPLAGRTGAHSAAMAADGCPLRDELRTSTPCRRRRSSCRPGLPKEIARADQRAASISPSELAPAMPSTVAIQDLKIGMFIRLELGWMSHPFPLSSFRIASADQISTIRGLGLKQVIWVPEKSAIVEETPGPVVADAPVEPTESERLAAARRQLLQAQRDALQRCEAQYDEASQTLRQVNALLSPEPATAGSQAQQLARAMLDKMLVEGELCIRLLSSQSGDRLTAHALNVTVISMLMGRALGLSEAELLDVGTGALLHDIGKVDLPTRVHHLEDGFSSAEVKAYRDHVTMGVARARQMDLSMGAMQVLAQHHELADGTGFPQRLGLDGMTAGSRLVALVNRYDNLCNPGPRGVALTPHEAVSVLFAQSRSKFDMPILSGFIRMMGVYPAGSVVQLTDDRYAVVMQVNSSRPLKPRVLVHDAKVPRDEALLLDLERETDLGIRRSVQPSKLPPAAAAYLAPKPRVTYYFDNLEATHDDVEAELVEVP